MAIVSILVILLVLGVCALVINKRLRKNGQKTIYGFVGAGMIAAAVVTTAFSSFYTQDAGEAHVQVSFTGALAGQTTTPGMHFKAPWVTTRVFDIRNNVVSYVGNGESGDHSGGNATGAQISFQDKEGVTGNMDLTVRYSLSPDKVLDIYREYQNQQDFVSRLVTNDIRSVSRNIPARYTTIEVYNNRETIALEIQESLEKKWSDDGVVVEEVSLQEIRYSDDVKARFDEAQASRIAQSKAEADQEVARVAAETAKIEAQGTADANGVLSQSLTPEILQQKYIDALDKASTIYVVPEGSTPMVGVPSAK